MDRDEEVLMVGLDDQPTLMRGKEIGRTRRGKMRGKKHPYVETEARWWWGKECGEGRNKNTQKTINYTYFTSRLCHVYKMLFV